MIEHLRQQMPEIPFAIREAILANVVVDNFDAQAALFIAAAIRKKLAGIQLLLPLSS